MNKRQTRALTLLGCALMLGAIAQLVAQQEAALLGLSALELFVLGLGAGALVKRQVA